MKDLVKEFTFSKCKNSDKLGLGSYLLCKL